ncbi:DUF6338 family protein [Erwinia rhapontici]|uniref:DUF6338 family protein n=1 Tax=Erwinia rhapontici TaxID=55212 RepID=UPI001060ACE2|nr:DUF6338 family protein [Erwinia rhapontici]TDS98331.1 hypothetical protein EDF84_10618 [Erwinia rhapontici]
MESISTELFNILKFLLPGFLTTWVFHAFTPYPKPAQFERVVQALIFTIIIQGAILPIKFILIHAGKYYSLGSWTETVRIMWVYFTSLAIGLTISYFANNDKFHSLLRYLKVTKQSSYHSEWYGAFHDREGCRIILNLVDGRRIFGYPLEWPSDPSKGHFVLTEAAWIIEIENVSNYVDLPQLDAILFKVNDVERVDFMKKE